MDSTKLKSALLKRAMALEVFTSRDGSLAAILERMVRETAISLDAALYRFNNPRLARALKEVAQRGVLIRLVLDRNKYEESSATRDLLSSSRVPFRLLGGRQGRGSKMHHKFVILDARTAVTGSYNWTLESEDQNYENLVILGQPEQVRTYCREFAALWAEAVETHPG